MKRASSVFYLGFVCLAPIGGMSAWAGPQKARQVAPREAPLPVPRPLDAPADVASLAPLAPPEPDFDASPAPAPKASAEPASPGAGSRRSRHERIVSPALRALVAQHAQANEVPFGLAHAIILIESGYNPGLSHAGAFGLMQIKAETARSLGFSGGASGLLDPDTNLRFGMRYLASAWRASGGDLCGAVMRYQSGGRAVRMTATNRASCARVKDLMRGA